MLDVSFTHPSFKNNLGALDKKKQEAKVKNEQIHVSTQTKYNVHVHITIKNDHDPYNHYQHTDT